MKKFWQDFKKFISRGNIIDLSVAVVVGGAFSAIVSALTDKIIRPLINWIISLCVGSDGLESVYTILNPYYDPTTGLLDLTKSVYIDWGAFISAILNFLIISITIFTVLRIIMKTQGIIKKNIGDYPTKAERKILKQQGVNFKNLKEVLAQTAILRESNKTPTPAPKPTQEELLTSILEELKKQNSKEQEKVEQNQIGIFEDSVETEE